MFFPQVGLLKAIVITIVTNFHYRKLIKIIFFQLAYMTETGNSKSTDQYVTPAQMKSMRALLGFTQVEAAEFLWVSIRTYQNWEYGVTPPPRGYYELFALKAKHLGIIQVISI